ncbi:MAG: tetratricopeptide repeat protein [Selenomonas sp.]|nr:tetratricopeptide repeat protein [Selenomonas sp.]
MQIIHQAPLAALGLGAAFTVIWGVADPVAAFAEVRVIEADGYYIMGDGPEENAAVAKERARADARRAASEQAGLYVAGMTEVKKGKLTRDEIRTISAAVLEVKEDNVTPEVLGGTVIQYHCRMKAVVDTGSITDQLRQDREELAKSVRRNEELEADLARVNAELAELKERYKTASEAQKQEINREIKRNEDEFTAAQWNEKGIERYNRKDYQGAIEYYRKAIELDPKYARPWNNMGIAYGKLGDYNKEIEYCRKAIELDPKYASPWNNMGYAYGHLGDYNKEIECYRKAIELDPKDAYPWNNMGHAYWELGDYNKAIECCRKAIELDPTLASPWNNMGYAYGSLGDYNKEIECCRKAIELDPTFAYPWNNMGLAYRNLGDYNKAIECYRKAIELDPTFAYPWNNMGLAYYRLGNYPKAVECLRKAVELKPGSESYQRNLETAKKKL